MNNCPKVSILVPVYNVETRIERCVRSLFEQTYPQIEYIFVDDCSPDNSIEIVKSLQNEYIHRKENIIIIQHKKNRGLSAARNTAVEHCTGEFILHVDSDDYIEFDAVEKLLKKQRESEADIVTGQGVMITREGKMPMEIIDFDDHLAMTENMIKLTINHRIWGRLIRTSLYKEHRIQAKEGINIGEDQQVMPQLAYYAEGVTSIGDVIYYYDCTNDNSYLHTGYDTQKQRNRLLQDIASTKVLHFFFHDKGNRFLEIVNECLAFLYSQKLPYTCEWHLKKEFNEALKYKLCIGWLENGIERKFYRIVGYNFFLCCCIRKLKLLSKKIIKKKKGC